MEDDAVHGLWLQIVDGFAFEGEARLRFEELLLETCAAAKGYDWVFADHVISSSRSFFGIREW